MTSEVIDAVTRRADDAGHVFADRRPWGPRRRGPKETSHAPTPSFPLPSCVASGGPTPPSAPSSAPSWPAPPGRCGELIGLPARLLAVAGLSLLPYAAFLAWLATRAAVPRAAAWAPVLLNVVWAVDCVALAMLQADAEPLLVGFIAVQVVTVLDVRRARVRRSPARRRAAAAAADAGTRAGHRLSSPRGPQAQDAPCAPQPAAAPAAAAAPRSRFDRLDALRGVAIVWMAIFHFCYDLNYFGFIQQNMLQRPEVDAAARRHRHPVPALRRRRPGDRQPAGPAARPVLEALGADRRLRAAGERSPRG